MHTAPTARNRQQPAGTRQAARPEATAATTAITRPATSTRAPPRPSGEPAYGLSAWAVRVVPHSPAAAITITAPVAAGRNNGMIDRHIRPIPPRQTGSHRPEVSVTGGFGRMGPR